MEKVYYNKNYIRDYQKYRDYKGPAFQLENIDNAQFAPEKSQKVFQDISYILIESKVGECRVTNLIKLSDLQKKSNPLIKITGNVISILVFTKKRLEVSLEFKNSRNADQASERSKSFLESKVSFAERADLQLPQNKIIDNPKFLIDLGDEVYSNSYYNSLPFADQGIDLATFSREAKYVYSFHNSSIYSYLIEDKKFNLRIANSKYKTIFQQVAKIPFSQLGLQKVGRVELDPARPSADLDVYYQGENINLRHYEKQLKQIAKDVDRLETLFDQDCLKRLYIFDKKRLSAYYNNQGSKDTIAISLYENFYKNSDLLKTTVEHELIHAFAEKIKLAEKKPINSLFLTIWGKEKKWELYRTKKNISPRARETITPLFYKFLNEKNYFNIDENIGHAQDNVDEYIASFVHSLMYPEHLLENIKKYEPEQQKYILTTYFRTLQCFVENSENKTIQKYYESRKKSLLKHFPEYNKLEK